MNWDRIEGNCKEFKGKARTQWGKLTDDDLDVIEGNRDQLEGRIQQQYGYDRDRAKREVDDWIRRMQQRNRHRRQPSFEFTYEQIHDSRVRG
jgi:uncharacterized protein YjbJ (UPF0337 family)